MEIPELLRETGDEVRGMLREGLPEKKDIDVLDESAEKIWRDRLTGHKEFNAAVVGEEGTFFIEEDPDYAFLVDPLDGSSGAINGEDPWNTTAVTVLEDVEVSGSKISGKPIGSYIRQIDRNGSEFSSWNGEPSIDGEVRYTEVDYEDNLPGKIDDTRIGPIEDDSLMNLEEKRYISVYAGSAGRRTVKENFLHPIQDQNPEKIRTLETGGSYTGAAVGFGKYLIGGEPKPTLPTEAAGEIFAKAMGASSSDIFGDENDRINVIMGDDGPERSYSSIIASNEEVLNQALDAINLEELQKGFGNEFEQYLSKNYS